jgi:alpha-1,6-mannosyltransferase
VSRLTPLHRAPVQQAAPASTLHFTNSYHEHSGGIRTLYHALLDSAEERGRHLTLVVPARQDGEERWGRTTRIMHVAASRSPAVVGRYRLILPHRFLPAGREPLWALLDKVRPDVVEVCDKYSLCYFAGLIRRARRSTGSGPALVGLSCERLDDNLEVHVPGGRLLRTAARAFLGRAYIGMFDVHLANSEYTADELRAAMRAPHERPVHVCRMGVDRRFGPGGHRRFAIRRRLLARCGHASDGNAALIIYAGRLSPEKHVMLLPATVQAAAGTDRPLHLIVAGDGPLRRNLEAECRKLLPGRAHFLGHITDRDDLAGLIAACDAFLHVNHREPFGIGPLEAMGLGTPVVMAASGGLLSYGRHDNAWLAEPGARGLGDALRACLLNDADRRRRVENGRVTADAHLWANVTPQIFEVYDAATAKRV